jgi:hypothetical protein
VKILEVYHYERIKMYKKTKWEAFGDEGGNSSRKTSLQLNIYIYNLVQIKMAKKQSKKRKYYSITSQSKRKGHTGGSNRRPFGIEEVIVPGRPHFN